jgi:predicted SprT family Zn-dependent metalloprotease
MVRQTMPDRNTNDKASPSAASDGHSALLSPLPKPEDNELDRTIQHPPTVEQFGALQRAFDYFNEALFEDRLPACILNLSRKRGAGGFFAAERWEKEESVIHEISLNPKSLEPPMERVMSILVHEMVHLWQEEFGKPGRRNYHNVQWAGKMEEVGLVPSRTGKPGGKRIGDSMSHYVNEEGPFKEAFDAIPERALMPWRTALQRKRSGDGNGANGNSGDGGDGDGKRKKSKVKYSCAVCPANVWGKPGLQLRCGCGKTEQRFDELG